MFCLNLIGRAHERINVHRALLILRRYMKPERILVIGVDGITFQTSKRQEKGIDKNFNELKYNTVHQVYRDPPAAMVQVHTGSDQFKGTHVQV